jgi:hypothetical protein
MLIVRRPSIAPVGLGAAALVIGAGLLAFVAWAPEEAPAAPADIGAAVDEDLGAPCTAGLNDPGDTRRTAGWFQRCRGRVADEWAGPVRLTSERGTSSLIDLELTAGTGPGVTPDVGGFVVVQADAWARSGGPARCPCPVALAVRDETEGVASGRVRGRIGSQGDPAAMSTQQVFPINAGETKSFAAVGHVLDPERGDVEYTVRLTALFVPVAAESDNTLSVP